jgi:endonuclease YncB( thermonuclease family)
MNKFAKKEFLEKIPCVFLLCLLLASCDSLYTLIPDELENKPVYLDGQELSYTITDDGIYLETSKVDDPLAPLLKLMSNEEKAKGQLFYGTLESIDHIYDGDTIGRVIGGVLHGVSVRIYPVCDFGEDETNMLWLGVECREDGIFTETKIRISGIDAPERAPKKAGRTEESLNREKAKAAAALEFLKSLVLKYTKDGKEIGFAIRIIDNSKFGDTLADVILFNDEVYVNVATEMIKNGHAVSYDGGTKTHDWGAE